VYTEKPSRSQEGIVFARTNHGRVLQYTGVTRIPTRRRCDEICHLCTYDTDCCIIYSALGEDGSYLLQLVHRITTSYRGYTWRKMRYVSHSHRTCWFADLIHICDYLIHPISPVILFVTNINNPIGMHQLEC